MKARLLAYLRFADLCAGISALIAFWGVLLVAFIAHMAPRFAYLAGKPIGDDLPCHAPECDFGVFWPAGILARAGSFTALYDHDRFGSVAASMLNTQSYIEHFLYPPPMLPLMAAISYFPFEYAAFIWMAGQLLIAGFLFRLCRFSWPVVLAALLSPAALFGTEIGQVGVLCDALLVSGLILSATRAASGGVLLGLLAIKPQIGLIIPFALCFRRHFHALVYAFAAAAILCGLSLLWFGFAPWRAFLSQGREGASYLLNLPFDPHTLQGWGVSSFWMARSFGLGIETSRLIQLIIACSAIAALYALRRRANFTELTVYVSLLISPYGFAYGMVAYSLMLAESARQRGWRIGLLDALLFLWPGLCLVISIATGHELTPFIVLTALLRAALRAPPPVLPAPAQE